MRPEDVADLGEPDLRIGGLHVWFHGREFEHSHDHWDGNWMRVTAFCRYQDAWVSSEGAGIRLPEIVGLLDGCERIRGDANGMARLDCVEPNLYVELRGDKLGHVHVKIEITPDRSRQMHIFYDELDQSHLSEIIRGCRAILEKFPVRDARR